MALDKAFHEYGLHRVYLNVLSDNKAAIRLYEKSGFTLEGEFRDHLKIGEQYMNWKWYGILVTEYKRTNVRETVRLNRKNACIHPLDRRCVA